jgi:amino acid efflux transporter
VGSGALLAWAYHLALALPLVFTLRALAVAVGDATGIGDFAAKAFGSEWDSIVRAFYFVGILVGQVVVSSVGGLYLADALGAGETAGRWLAAVVLVAGAALALGGWRTTDRGRVVTFLVVTVLIVVSAGRILAGASTPSVSDPAAGGVRGVGYGAFLLFFAFVGWEGVVRLIRAPEVSPRGEARSVVAGFLLVAALYGTLAVVAGKAPRPLDSRFWLLTEPFGSWLGRLVGLVAGTLCILFCGRNIATAAGLGRTMASRGVMPGWMATTSRDGVPVASVLVLATGALGGLAVANLDALRIEHFVAVPDAMAIALYLTACLSGLRLLRGRDRLPAVAGALGCLVVLPFGGPALLFPGALVLIHLAFRRRLQASPGGRSHG